MILYALSPFLRLPLQPGPCHCHPNHPRESRLVPSESMSWLPEAIAAVMALSQVQWEALALLLSTSTVVLCSTSVGALAFC